MSWKQSKKDRNFSCANITPDLIFKSTIIKFVQMHIKADTFPTNFGKVCQLTNVFT